MRKSLISGTAKSSRCRPFSKSYLPGTRKLSTDAPSTPVTTESSPRVQQKRNFLPKKRILSGIQPTGVPHLGNYLGALRQWKHLQAEKLAAKKSQNVSLYFSIVDLHALTGKNQRQQLLAQTRQTYASLLAIGLDPKESVIFVQSKVQYHPYLMWILSTVASTGYLSRMTQWKSKLGLSDDTSLDSDSATDKLKLGLFSYPVLQAADILLYQPTHVPVGEDQAQHIEFARSLAKSFNAHYGSLKEGEPFFRLPKLMLSPAKRIMSLKDPHSKMSKSDPNPASRILITDSSDNIHMKLRSALTDSIEGISYEPGPRPGVSNLVEILKHVSKGNPSCEEIAADNANLSMRAFKEHLAHNIINELQGIRERYEEIINSSNPSLDESMERGNSTARASAGYTMAEVEKIVGLRPIYEKTRPIRTKSASSTKKVQIQREQEIEEKAAIEEPHVLPQSNDGVDRPIAS